MLQFPPLDNTDPYTEKLAELGYECIPKRRFSDRHFCHKGYVENRTHYLNLCEITSNIWRDKLFFRDYLRNKKEARDAYAALKKELYAAHKNDREQYTELKSNFVMEMLDKAKKNI